MTAAPVVTVFVGPSLRSNDRSYLRDAAESADCALDLRPPVRRQDLSPLMVEQVARSILVLDGEFGQSLAVSVTEIRALLFAGRRLAGAASMGALRAVECRTIGMTGSGWVYEQYLSEAIDSDGEVALLYDPFDYTPVTMPLVNVRWLVNERVRAHDISAEDARTAVTVARALNFRTRRPSVLLRAWRRELSASVVQHLEEQIAPDRIDESDRKRLDALEAVEAALDCVSHQ